MTKQQQIKKACRKAYNTLVEEGRRPTVNTVSTLVTGDRNAITQSLKELREEYEVDKEGRSVRLPVNVTRAMEQVYLDLKGGIEESCTQKVIEVTQQLNQCNEQKQQLSEELNIVTLELETLRATLQIKNTEISKVTQNTKKELST